MDKMRGGGRVYMYPVGLFMSFVWSVHMRYEMSRAKHMILCLSSASHSQLIACQEISGITTGRCRARLHIIPLLKVSDCTEIITHEIDSGIFLKDLGMSGGFVRRNGFFKAKGEGKDKRMKAMNRDESETQRKNTF